MLSTIKLSMLIDDEQIDQKIYQRVLQRSELVEESLTFTYAQDALDFLKSNPDIKVDVIFLDINMPRMNGFEFLDALMRDLGENNVRMVVVMLTTSIDPLDRERAESNPLVRDFFDKPLSVDQVKRVLDLLNEEAS